MEIATRNVIAPGSVGLAPAHPLTKPPAMRKQPDAGLGPVTVHPTNHSLVLVHTVVAVNSLCYLPGYFSRRLIFLLQFCFMPYLVCEALGDACVLPFSTRDTPPISSQPHHEAGGDLLVLSFEVDWAGWCFSQEGTCAVADCLFLRLLLRLLLRFYKFFVPLL